MLMSGCVILSVVITVAYCEVASDPAVYSGPSNSDAYQMKILRKPGDCKKHKDYPNTMQCAETGLCISFAEQFNNSKCDCCGPEKDCKTCSDQSDENRVAPPGNGQCTSHPHYQYGLVYQCAKNHSICLSRLLHWNNGQCDCCPEQNFVCGHPNCTDHSDEECLASEWPVKFSCDGNCIAISKYADSETDCFSDCEIEGSAVARAGCEAKKNESAAKGIEDFCTLMIQKNTAHFRCTSGDKQCIPAGCVRDNRRDCPNGEDEDDKAHPDCPVSTKTSKCEPGVVECVLVNSKSDSADCRCRPANNSTLPLDNCNKDRPQRRRRLF